MPHDERYHQPAPRSTGILPDPLTDLLRSGAQRLIQQAIEAELGVLLEAYAGDKTNDGRARLVRHGHLAPAFFAPISALRTWHCGGPRLLESKSRT
jgi:hypothetical protein